MVEPALDAGAHLRLVLPENLPLHALPSTHARSDEKAARLLHESFGGKTYTLWCCLELARGPFTAVCGYSLQSSHGFGAHPSRSFS